ncbi:DUF1810 domain-containing protein [Rhizobium helianthi]|uniref:DUF1810 domain-containing protein n=1 Tax=Rhizobium helianthi TaxID=1132695 RepID=A0ABW4M2K6_9HYPH
MQFDLDRFITAQATLYPRALQELREGRKQSHWMWFIFPQLAGLGRSETARFYALSGKAEAQAYRQHPLLDSRLVEATRAMLGHSSKSAFAILGSPDDLKFCSCMTLFAAISEKGSPFERALEQFCDGKPDQTTLGLLADQSVP